ncbi:MAG: hypothetical protein WC310_05065 [Patescibacteria group bacterium]|jgi:uncharacterized membrane protein
MEENTQGTSPTPAPTPAPVPPTPPASKPAGSGLEPKVAAALSYVLGFITGAFFFFTSKDKFVKFHAMQSIITSVALIIIDYILGFALRYSWWRISGVWNLIVFVLFIFLIYKAYNQEKYKLPLIGDWAEKWSSK